MSLDDILTDKSLNRGKHDQLILRTENMMLSMPSVYRGFRNATYKIKDERFRGGYNESDVDLLMFQSREGVWDYNNWREIPFGDAKLLVYEMKSSDSGKSRHKAEKQLVHHYNTIVQYSDYNPDFIELFYVYGVGSGFVIEWFDKSKGDLV